MPKIIFFKGGVETLSFFSKELEKYFIDKGFKTFVYDLNDALNSYKHLKKFIKSKETFLLTFNFLGLSGEDYIYDENTGYIWDLYDIPVFNIVVDHPLYYKERFEQLPKKYMQYSIDEDHLRYMKWLYPDVKMGQNLYLAGTTLNDYIFENSIDEWYQNRPTDVIFTGSYMNYREYEPFITRINEEYEVFYRRLIDSLFANPLKSFTEVIRPICEEEMGELSLEDWRITFQHLNFIDLYVRAKAREQVLTAIVDAGIKVDIYGTNWDKCPFKHPENAVIHGGTDSINCLKNISKSKISLNVLPWFKEGPHDRIFNSMANGAAVLTDENRYLNYEFNDSEDILCYDINNVVSVGERIRELLMDRSTLYGVAKAGYERVIHDHVWSKRAEIVYQDIINEMK